MFAGDTPPTGWLICDGSAVSRTTYATLFAAIGTKWGTGDGSTTFNLPDFRGRAPIGVTSGAAYRLGGTGGSQTHSHTIGGHAITINEMPAHNHYPPDGKGGFLVISSGTNAINSPETSSGFATGTLWSNTGKGRKGSTNNTGGGAEHTHSVSSASNMSPYAAVNFIICTGKTD